nr:RNA-directed DNA polymerase, eukaryota [Tanacetum cinerariifolium]
MNYEVVKDKVVLTQESSSKRACDNLDQGRSKKQKVEDDKESEELKRCLEIIPDDGDDITIDATPLSIKTPIIDYKIYKEKKLLLNFQSRWKFSETMFEHYVEDTVWKNQQGLTKVKNWKFFDSCGVHCVSMQNTIYYLLVENMGGSESAQLESLSELIEGVILSNSRDRWFWDMNGSGSYRVKDVRNMLDYLFLPKDEVAMRWLPHLSIKLNVFAWRLYLDRLPTKSNLIRRGIQVGSPMCPNCVSYDEDVPHIFFKCPLAIEVSRVVCRWWDVVWVPCGSYSEWLSWLLSIKKGSRIISLFEGV